MSTPGWVWATLGIEATRDRALIRRAYAERLRENPPGTDAQQFQRLRSAYDRALAGAASARTAQPDDAPGTTDAAHAPVSFVAADLAAPPPPATVPTREGPRHAPVTVDPEPGQRRATARAAFEDLKARLSGRVPSRADDLAASLNLAIAAAGALPLAEWPQFERTLAALLWAQVPRSDSLLKDAAQRMGWGQDHLRAPSARAVGLILERIEAQRVVATLRRTDGTAIRALDVLAAPLPADRPFSRWRYGFENAEAVRILFAETLPVYPQVQSLLPEETTHWWNQYLARPHASQRLVICAALVSAYALADVAVQQRLDPATFATGSWLAVAILAGPAIVAGWLGLVEWPRHLLRGSVDTRPSLPRRLGWVPYTLGLLLLAPWLPDRPASAAAVAVAGAVACAWASTWGITGLPPRVWARIRLGTGLLLQHPLIGLWALVLATTAPWPLAAATLVTAVVAVTGQAALVAELRLASRRVRGIVTGAVISSCMLVGGLIWTSLAEETALAPLAVSAGAMLLLSRSLPLRVGFGNLGGMRYSYWLAIVLLQFVRGIPRGLADAPSGTHGAARAVAALMMLATLVGIWTNRSAPAR